MAIQIMAEVVWEQKLVLCVMVKVGLPETKLRHTAMGARITARNVVVKCRHRIVTTDVLRVGVRELCLPFDDV